jgi:hypothetical protein
VQRSLSIDSAPGSKSIATIISQTSQMEWTAEHTGAPDVSRKGAKTQRRPTGAGIEPMSHAKTQRRKGCGLGGTVGYVQRSLSIDSAPGSKSIATIISQTSQMEWTAEHTRAPMSHAKEPRTLQKIECFRGEFVVWEIAAWWLGRLVGRVRRLLASLQCGCLRGAYWGGLK